MRKTSTPFVDEEISKLKLKLEGRDHHHPPTRENVVPPNLIDSPLNQPNLKDERIFRLASHDAALDELAEATQFMKELFEKEREAGNIPKSLSYSDWIKKLKISLSEGGRVGFDEGGSTAAERYEAKIKELMDKGLSRELAEVLVITELSPNGYRILKKDGGKVVDFIKYAKSKQPKIKEIKMSDYFDLGRTMASLSQHERETLGWLLNKSKPKK